MSKKKATISCLDQYRIDHSSLPLAELPEKIWSFIDSVADQAFDMLDLADFFHSDTPTSKKIIDFLVQNKVCVTTNENISYEDWKKKNGNPTKKITTTTSAASDKATDERALIANTTEDTDITVTKQKQAHNISLEIG